MPLQSPPENMDQFIMRNANELIQSLRQAAPKVTEAAVQYVWAQGVTGLIIAGVLGIIALASFAKFAYWSISDRNMTNFDQEGGALVISIVGITCGIACFGMISKNLPKVLAPEGAALLMLLGR